MTKPSPKPKADWEAIERDYRLGIYTVVELAERYGGVVSRQAIEKRARLREWTKDLSGAVKQATKAKVIAAQVRAAVVAQVQAAVAPPEEDATTQVARRVALVAPKAIDAVEVAADANAGVILRHRSNLLQISELAVRMMGELADTTLHAGELQGMFDMLHSDCDPPALVEAKRRFDDLMRLPTRVGAVQKLVDSITKAQVAERRAHGLDDEESKPKDGDSLWTSVNNDSGTP